LVTLDAWIEYRRHRYEGADERQYIALEAANIANPLIETRLASTAGAFLAIAPLPVITWVEMKTPRRSERHRGL